MDYWQQSLETIQEYFPKLNWGSYDGLKHHNFSTVIMEMLYISIRVEKTGMEFEIVVRTESEDSLQLVRYMSTVSLKECLDTGRSRLKQELTKCIELVS